MSTQHVTQPPTAAPVNGASPPNGAIPVAPVATPIQPPVTQAPVAAVVPAVATPVVAAPVVAAPVVAAPIPVAATPVAPAPATAVPPAAPVAPVAAAPMAAPVAAAPVATAAPQVPVPTPVAVAPVAPTAAPVAASPAPAAASAPAAVSATAAAPPPVPAASAPAAPKPAAAKAPPKVILAPRLGKQKTDWKTLSTVVTISLLMHALALAACGLIVFNNPKILEEIFTEVTDNKEITDEPIVEQSLEQPNDIKETSDDQTMTSATEQVFDLGSTNMNINDLAPAQVKVEGDAPGLADIKFDNAASGRMSTAAKAALVRSMGGNSASEAAVAHGMRWLAKHQFPDGGWSFKHEAHAECKGQCSQSGTLEGGCRTGATGMALLAFLGGGHTHQSGDYQKEVKGGIEFLLKNAKSTPQGLDLCPTVVANEKMYTQGLCTIALSELAALTKDNRVKTAATGAVAFIVAGQNPKSGGWRYVPYPASADPGDKKK